MVTVSCSQCGLEIRVPESVRGARGVCFGCGARLVVPAPAAPAATEFRPGQRLHDRYEVRERVGKGGMGVVYAAYDLLVGEAVALKVMNPKVLRTQRGQHLFIREAQVARRLRHENIVAVHDVGRTPEGMLYLSMEYLAGQSLRAHLNGCRRDKRYPHPGTAVRVMDQVLAALAHAHRTVVHRDIKPENVHLLPGERVKVLDFGLARAVYEGASAEDGPTPGPGGKPIGTAAYAAPEQRRRQEVDARADVYAAGLVLYELLTLRTPIDKQVEVAAVRSDVSPSLLCVLERARQEDPANRYASADAFRGALVEAYAASYESDRTASAEAAAEPGRASTAGMVRLDGGSFVMGSAEHPDEAPEHEAFVEPFWIDRDPVTVAQYTEFLNATGRTPPRHWGAHDTSGAQQPVVGVTWDDANAYAAWAGKQLPTEAQWEFAARGRENRRYPWGALEPRGTLANFGDNLNMPSLVGMHDDGATPEGVHDLSGNVYEWTRDWFGPHDVPPDARRAHDAAPRRVVKGGSWHSPPRELRTSFRKGAFPETADRMTGFRCVVPAE
jgi:formylglycine-generating enzyme required for sulfatase activity